MTPKHKLNVLKLLQQIEEVMQKVQRSKNLFADVIKLCYYCVKTSIKPNLIDNIFPSVLCEVIAAAGK